MISLLHGLSDWLDDRVGYRTILHAVLWEKIPGGSRWIYVTGSMLVMAFVTQVITGLFLWMFYSPGSQNAWESVFWIENEVACGWFLRGVHHYMSQAMAVLLPIHLLQVVLCKAYVKPREMNYWLGLVLMLLVLALGLTGYLLPWDQKGYWATKVATELMSLPPGGGMIQRLVVGGDQYGHYTLTRFFALHAGVLPGLLVIVLVLHIALFRKHGITAKGSNRRPDERFWPIQAFKDSVACLCMLIIVVTVVVVRGGAELGPPAEPMESYGAARPEWYYLFLFQLLKKDFLPEIVAAIILPGLVMLFLFCMPLIAGRVRFAHVVNVVVLFILMGGVVYLTMEAVDHDRYANRYANGAQSEPDDPEDWPLHVERLETSKQFMAARHQAEREYERLQELIEYFGIPREGAAMGLVRLDSEIQGPRIFSRYCASCHSYNGPHATVILGPFEPHDERGQELASAEPFGAPNLYRFGSREWLAKILDPKVIGDAEIFGRTLHHDGLMAEFVRDELSELTDEQQAAKNAIIAAVSAEANLPLQRKADDQARDDGTIAKGLEALNEEFESQACLYCHPFHDEGDDSAPDLTGYASYQWLYDFIANPQHQRFYGEGNDRMPAFAAHARESDQNLLTLREIDLLVRWLRSDDLELETSTIRPQGPR